MNQFDPSERDLETQLEHERTYNRSTRDVSDLLVSLDADDAKRRGRAAWELAKVAADTPERVPVDDLAGAITDHDQWVRRGATWALAEIAQTNPDGVRPTMQRVFDCIGDGDPLVRENAVVTVAGVAETYPRVAQPVLASLLELRNVGDGTLRRYATEALRHIVESLSEATLDGNPIVISVSDPELATSFPVGVNVVRLDDGDTQSGEIRIEPASAVDAERTKMARRRSTAGTGPPSADDIASPSTLSVTISDFEKLRPFGRSPLVTAVQARALTPSEQHAMVTLFTVRSDRRTESLSDAFIEALDRWEAIDDHDHVLTIRARGESSPWVATEFTDGGTVATHFDDGLAASLWYAHSIVRTVSHAHALGVVHGGLNPSAVRFATTFGSTWPVPKVGDWGFAEVMADVQLQPVPSGYAAPEHLAPESFGSVDHSTDVYGLGAVLYALLVGTEPFVGDPHLVVKQVTATDPPTPTDVNADLPDWVNDVLERALAKRKRDRYETVEDLLVTLERGIDDYDTNLMSRIT